MIAMTRATSAAVVASPSDSRIAARARSRPSIASMTGDGSAVPALHALPLDTLTPSRSSAATSSGPRHVEKETFST